MKVNKGFLNADSSRYFLGVVDATFSLNNRGSTEEQENVYVGLNNNLDLMYMADRSATIVLTNLNYFKIGDGPTIFNGFIHVREIFRRAESLTPEVFGQAQFDESRNMQFRWLLGGGYRWNVLQSKNQLYAGLGLFREFEQWQGADAIIQKRLWKMNSYFSADIRLTSSVTVNAITYFQTGYDHEIEKFRHRLSGQVEFKNALTQRFKLKTTGIFLLDDKPIIPLNRFLYEVYFGVEYSFN